MATVIPPAPPPVGGPEPDPNLPPISGGPEPDPGGGSGGGGGGGIGGGGGGGGGGAGGGLGDVRDTTQFNPEIKSAAEEAIMKLLGGGGFDNLDTQQAILRGESSNALRDARLSRADASAARGTIGSGGDRAADDNMRRSLLTERLKGLTDLNTRDQQFGLQKSQLGLSSAAQQEGLQQQADQLGINRDLGLRGQDLQNLISKRSASVQRYGIDVNREISQNELSFRREGLEQDIVEQNRRFGLATDQQELDEAFRQAGLSEQTRQFDTSFGENTRQFDIGAGFEQDRLDLGTRAEDRAQQGQTADIAMQELLNTIRLMGLPGFDQALAGGVPSA